MRLPSAPIAMIFTAGTLALGAGCGDFGSAPPPEQGGPVADSTLTWDDVEPLFARNCRLPQCHGAPPYPNGLSLAAYDDALGPASVNGPVIVPGRSEESFLVSVLRGPRPGVTPVRRMPPGGPYLTEEEIELIAGWIDEGAKE